MTTRSLPKRPLWMSLTTVMAGGLLALTGCTSSSNAKSSTGTDTSPIKVFTVGNFSGQHGQLPEVRDAIKARIEEINANGGINGRKINLTVCDDQLDANRAVQCAQSAISAHNIADIADSSAFMSQYEPLLRQANIPIISTISGAPESYTSSISFPFNPVVIGAFMGMPQVLASHGSKKISMIVQGGLGNAGAALEGEFRDGVKVAGATVAKVVTVPATTTDFGPSVNSALSGGADGVVTYMGGLQQANLVKAIRQLYPNVPVAMATFALTPPVLQALGSAGDGVHVIGLTAPLTSDAPAVKQYLADMAKYEPSSPKTDQALVGYLGAWTFERVAKDLPSLTAQTLLQKLGTLTSYSMGGAVPPITTTHNCTACGDKNRLFNSSVTFLSLKNGQLTEDTPGQFYDVFTGKTVTASP